MNGLNGTDGDVICFGAWVQTMLWVRGVQISGAREGVSEIEGG